MSIATSAADRVEAVDVDERTVRAASEYLAVVNVVDTLYHVYSEEGTEYVVDVELKACTCPDMEYRNPPNGCKHIRRIELVRGDRAVPAGVRVDPLLADQRDQEASR